MIICCILLISFFIQLFLGFPIAVALGVSSILAILCQPGLPLVIVAQRMFVSVNSFTLLAVPLYMFAGSLMGFGGISKRIIKFPNSLVGHVTGGMGLVNILASMIFAGISGSAVADTAGIGKILIPEMLKKKYSKEYSSAVTAISSTIGIVIPPSIPMILIGGMVGISVGRLFLGGIIPGLAIGFSLMLVAYFLAKRENMGKGDIFNFKELVKSFREAIWALFMPIVIIGGIITGMFTPTEAGGIAVVYAFLVGWFVYKELTSKSLVECLWNTVLTVAKIFYIIATAGLFSWLLISNGFAVLVGNFLFSITKSPLILLFIMNLFILLITTFMESIATLVLLVPIFYPIALQVGIDPIHFGVMIVIALGIGMVTPPVGLCLYIAADIANTSIPRVSKALLPYIAVVIILLTIFIFFPSITIFIPKLIMG